MNTNGQNPSREPPPSLGNTLFMTALCIVPGTVVFLIGIGVIPSGDTGLSTGGRLLAIAAGLLFIFAGFMIAVRDLAGARNNEEIPADAPLLLRLGGQILSAVLIAIFAVIASVIAFGPFFADGALPDLTRQMGGLGAALFRIVMGGFAILFWYGAVYIAIGIIRGGNKK